MLRGSTNLVAVAFVCALVTAMPTTLANSKRSLQRWELLIACIGTVTWPTVPSKTLLPGPRRWYCHHCRRILA